jgi:hypothetical protein
MLVFEYREYIAIELDNHTAFKIITGNHSCILL